MQLENFKMQLSRESQNSNDDCNRLQLDISETDYTSN